MVLPSCLRAAASIVGMRGDYERVSAELFDRALAGLWRRLLGERPAAPGSDEEGAVWQRVAQILPARIATEVID